MALDLTSSNASKKECIKVAIRVRPLLPHEYHKDEVIYYPPSYSQDSHALEQIKVADGQHMIESRYDKVFKQSSSQREVYEFVKESIGDVIKGFNTTIFAYGQTGSGKTYTMFGPHWEDNNFGQNTYGAHSMMGSSMNQFLLDQEKFGLIPRSIEYMFSQMEELCQEENQNFTVYCSFLQIYNEKLYDLFQDKENSKPLVIREDKFQGIFVEGLSEYVVTNAQDCFLLLKRGERNRITRQTRSNIHSSRSHTIFQILVESDTADQRGMLKRGKLNLCDLAGSEKIAKEENMEQQHLLELKTINLSLSSLGKVISALAQGKKSSHIPYRDSKITRILQDSLGGNTKTTLIAAVSPLIDCTEETISTLKFADRAKQVMVKVSANEMNAADDALINKLQKEVQHLKEILNLKRRGGANDVHQQLLQLKEENAKLKEMAPKVNEVERLKQENKFMRLELQKLKQPSLTDGFNTSQHFKPQALTNQFQSSNDKDSALFNQMNESAQDLNELPPIQKQGFFVTDSEYYQENQDSSNKQKQATYNYPSGQKQKPSPIKTHTELVPISQNQQQMAQFNFMEPQTTSSKPYMMETPLSSLGMNEFQLQQKSTMLTGNTSLEVQNMTVQQIADKLEQQRITELKQAALGMKGSLVSSGRCPKCTLKPPCKHFDRQEDLPSVQDIQPSLFRKSPAKVTPLQSNNFNGQPPLYPMNNQRIKADFINESIPKQSVTTGASSATNATYQSNSAFQNSGAQIALMPNTTHNSQHPASSLKQEQRVLQDLHNYTPSTTQSKKSPFNTNKSIGKNGQSVMGESYSAISQQQQTSYSQQIVGGTPQSKYQSEGQPGERVIHHQSNNRSYTNALSLNQDKYREKSHNIGRLQNLPLNVQSSFPNPNASSMYQQTQKQPDSSRSKTNLELRKLSQQQRPPNYFRLQHGGQRVQSTVLDDSIQVRIRGKNNIVETKTGSVTRTLDELNEQEFKRREIQKTTDRLKVLDKLEQYREEKLRREMEIYEDQRRKEEEEQMKAQQKEIQRQKYLDKQKRQLDNQRMRKIDNEMDKIKDIERKKQEEKMIKRQKEKFYKEQKQKIMEYKSKRQATEDLLANANVLDYEENYSEEGEDEGDALDRMVNGMANKSKPPAVS